jgi:glycosyltransferase involved in cell wall biosynthesis
MTQPALISIIIPTFNSGETLSVSFESIAQQTYKNVEVVIMDGLSSDNTLAITEGYKTQLPGLKVYSEKDGGIYDAMNKALEKATGEWIIFMGSDDRFHDAQVLENLSVALYKTKFDVVYGNAKILGDTGWAKDGDIYDGEFNLPKLLNQNICHQAILYRRSFINDKIGTFNTHYKKSSDWDFNLRCWAQKPFEFMDLIIADFAAGGFSTHSNDEKIYNDFVDNVLKYFKIGPFHPLVNNPSFNFYYKVLRKQQEDHSIRFTFEKLKKRILKKLKRS